MEAYSSIYAMQPTDYVLVIHVGWRETYSPAYIHLLSRCIDCEVKTEMRKHSYALRAEYERFRIHIVYCMFGRVADP